MSTTMPPAPTGALIAPPAPALPPARRAAPRGFAMVWKRHKLGVVGAAILLVVIVCAVFAPWLAPYSPDFQFPNGIGDDGGPLPPGGRFLLGTDLLGRDLLSRLIWGARTSLIIGIVANGTAVLVGTALGVVAGYLRGPVGGAIMRFTDLMMAFPALLLAIALAAVFEPSLWIVALVIAMVNWVQIARVIYTETTTLAEREFVTAARGLGAGGFRILWRHILPHLLPTILVWSTLGIATTVLLEATLSFLGIGVRPPTPSWGNIIFENQTYFTTAPWLVFFPAGAI
ncbi:MAG TPA: ABC transporter permease, partial [Acetobacteraceae bacterium]|nr:ABC transporter permease [Acetobacteraceae bacterium]